MTKEMEGDKGFLDKIGPLWRVHTANLLEEIAKNSGQSIYRQPLAIFANLLFQVGERAAELNDPELNALMCRLTIYLIADPKSPDYEPDRVREILILAEAKKTIKEAA